MGLVQGLQGEQALCLSVSMATHPCRSSLKTEIQVTQAQITKLVACITGDNTPLKRSGIKIANQTYIFLRCEPGRSVYGRKGADSGVCIVKTKRAVLVGVYGAGVQPGNCNSVMEKLADYLIEHGL